jgi:hypothetical protein
MLSPDESHGFNEHLVLDVHSAPHFAQDSMRELSKLARHMVDRRNAIVFCDTSLPQPWQVKPLAELRNLVAAADDVPELPGDIARRLCVILVENRSSGGHTQYAAGSALKVQGPDVWPGPPISRREPDRDRPRLV